MPEKSNKIFVTPEPDTKVAPVYEYTDEQQNKIKALREYTASIQLPQEDPYYPWELKWLSKPDTIPRYIRASKWNLSDAQRRIKATMEWRREFKPDLIPPEDVRIESETGKMILNGFDRDGRPLLYMRPERENTQAGPRQLRHLVWCLERARDLTPPGQESLVIIIDCQSATLRTTPSLSAARKVLTILQQHYPETLGRALIMNLPVLLSIFYKGISPLLHPVTRDKIRFNPDLTELIPRTQLDAAFGGDFHYEFEPKIYWDQIVEACRIAPDGTRLTGPDSDLEETTASAETASLQSTKSTLNEARGVPLSPAETLVEKLAPSKSADVSLKRGPPRPVASNVTQPFNATIRSFVDSHAF